MSEETFFFKDRKEFEKWLSENFGKSPGVWVRMYKKNSGVEAIKGPEMLDVLLCYGWITGQARKGNEDYALWRVCPRRKKSIWSKINIGHAERLIREGRMKPSGMKEIEEAKTDGRWERAYSSQKNAALPEDFLKEIEKNKKAKEFLKTLNKPNTYAIIFRIENAKTPEKRKEKIRQMIEMLERGEKFH